jgi:hypothetical protein
LGPIRVHPDDIEEPRDRARNVVRQWSRSKEGRVADRKELVSLFWNIVIVLGAVAVAVAAMLLVRRGAPRGGYFSDSDRASGVFGVLATGFAIFAGFVIFLAFTSYDQSRSGAEKEALTLVQQYETAQSLPVGVRGRLTGQLVCYGRYVVDQEWALMEHGKAGGTFNPWGFALFRTAKGAVPKTAVELSAYDNWLDQTSDREEARRDRIHGATGIIPTSLWVVLFMLAGVVFVYVLFYADSAERARSQAMMIGSATAALAVTLLAIHTLDNPYRPGLGSVKPVAMQRSLRMVDEARIILRDPAPIPCDSAGVAS